MSRSPQSPKFFDYRVPPVEAIERGGEVTCPGKNATEYDFPQIRNKKLVVISESSLKAFLKDLNKNIKNSDEKRKR